MNQYEYRCESLLTEEEDKHLDQILGTANFLECSKLTKIQKNQVWNIINNAVKLVEYNASRKMRLKKYEENVQRKTKT